LHNGSRRQTQSSAAKTKEEQNRRSLPGRINLKLEAVVMRLPPPILGGVNV
jgi:hypothetical protein